jgi:hypothetical protein
MTATMAAGAATTPWSAKQRLQLAALLLIGVLGLIAGYVGTSGTLRVSRQVAWVNVAATALLASGAGVVLFLTAARRTIGRRRLSLFGDITVGREEAFDLGPGAGAADLVSAPTMTKYHRSDCSFVAGKPGLKVATAIDHEKIGKRPCGVCLPGGAS